MQWILLDFIVLTNLSLHFNWNFFRYIEKIIFKISNDSSND